MDTRPTVLVVDDEEVVCNSCDRILSDEGFLVETSADARRGLELAEANDYAVVLLDIRMKEMDGLEYLKRLRSKKPDIPVIMITGYPERSFGLHSQALHARGDLEVGQAGGKVGAPRGRAGSG